MKYKDWFLPASKARRSTKDTTDTQSLSPLDSLEVLLLGGLVLLRAGVVETDVSRGDGTSRGGLNLSLDLVVGSNGPSSAILVPDVD